ncbi:hypothetical protein NDU88_008136 [Pleurodeles waltl]|uniref:Uncharacterized protein n=1 Tax=Pleurodeles waltl TaxID=8319 RepID=A0AAV7RRG2_PLEWA|nr:hypothetical protein NDU88_008136 [Pleurodeles waltl]
MGPCGLTSPVPPRHQDSPKPYYVIKRAESCCSVIAGDATASSESDFCPEMGGSLPKTPNMAVSRPPALAVCWLQQLR